NRGCCVARVFGRFRSRRSVTAPRRAAWNDDAQPQAVLGSDPSGGLVADLEAVLAVRASLEGSLPGVDGLGAAEAAGPNGRLGIGDAAECRGAGFRVTLDPAGGGLDGPEVTGRGALAHARLPGTFLLFRATPLSCTDRVRGLPLRPACYRFRHRASSPQRPCGPGRAAVPHPRSGSRSGPRTRRRSGCEPAARPGRRAPAPRPGGRRAAYLSAGWSRR